MEIFFRIVPVCDENFKYMISKCTGDKGTQRHSTDGKYVVLQMSKETNNDEIINKFPKVSHNKILNTMNEDKWKAKKEILA